MMRKGARFAASELLREPVKQAVREALREEADSVTAASDETGSFASGSASSGSSTEREDWPRQQSSDQEQSSGGRSKLASMGLVLAVVGVAYLARKRMSSTSGSAWSEQSAGDVATDDAEGGYVSEGEMQTAETADESGTSATTEQ